MGVENCCYIITKAWSVITDAGLDDVAQNLRLSTRLFFLNNSKELIPYMQRDIQDGVLIPFSMDERGTNIVSVVLTVISLGADSLAIYALVKQRYIPLDSRYIISIVCADLCYGIFMLVVYAINGIVSKKIFTS